MNSAQRCKRYRHRILDLSQQVTALHIGGAFSCMEITDCIYNELMQEGDTFIMSKGHGWMSQAVILEERGLLDLSKYGTVDSPVGVHPDFGTPGIACATGSLGHGLGMAVGMALADRKHNIYVIMSDGELQEGSTWEAVLLAGSHKLSNLIVVVDNNDLQSLGRTSETHPSLYPINEKFTEFGWLTDACHQENVDFTLKWNSQVLHRRSKPTVIIAKTRKGYPISFMLDKPIWHYRSPSKEEYQQALKELE